MDPEFWEERWREGQLGFHQAEVNGRLVAGWEGLGVAPGEPVWVPLCGKSLDMRWLAERGHPVIGSELSERAVRAFFAEADLEATWRDAGAFRVAESGPYTILCGDVFALEGEGGAEGRALLARAAGVYDRAALVALPPDLRRRYAQLYAGCLPAARRALLLCFEYDQSEMDGPPFSVAAEEVARLFGSAFEIHEVARSQPSQAPPRFRERGMSLFADVAYRLERR